MHFPGHRFTTLQEYSHRDEVPLKPLLSMIIDGAIIGILAGSIASAFRYIIFHGKNFHLFLISQHSLLGVLGTLVFVIALGVVAARLLQKAPMASGGGIPQIEAELRGQIKMEAWPVLIVKFVSGILTSLGGLSVGRGGPSIQMGGAVGKIIAQMTHKPADKERLMIAAGAAAGLAATFNAPLAATLFIFEGLRKPFSTSFAIPTLVAAMMANYVASVFSGEAPAMAVAGAAHIPLQLGLHLIACGVFVGIVGVLFNRIIFTCKAWYDSLIVSRTTKFVFMFLGMTFASYSWPNLHGSGLELAHYLSIHPGEETFMMLLLLLIGKMVLTGFCFGSGIPGGTFIPTLVIGATAGALLFNVFSTMGLIMPIYFSSFVVCGMGAMLAASMQMPLLTIVLVLEMTASFENVFGLCIVSVVAYITAKLLKEPPIYRYLLDQLLMGEEVKQR